MIAKKYRIEKNTVDYILEKGESFISKLFIIRYIPTDNTYNRYCVIVSKKIDNNSTGRNRLRRQIYEAIRTIPTKNEKQSRDIALIPKKRIISAKFEEIQKDIEEIINKHGKTK